MTDEEKVIRLQVYLQGIEAGFGMLPIEQMDEWHQSYAVGALWLLNRIRPILWEEEERGDDLSLKEECSPNQ